MERGSGRTIRGILNLAKEISLHPDCNVYIFTCNQVYSKHIGKLLDGVLKVLDCSELYNKIIYTSYDDKNYDYDECTINYYEGSNVIIYCDHYGWTPYNILIRNQMLRGVL